MRTAGTTRTVDRLGRFVIPAEMRRDLGIKIGDLLDASIVGDSVLLTPVNAVCALCGSDGGGTLAEIHGRHVCKPCIAELSR